MRQCYTLGAAVLHLEFNFHYEFVLNRPIHPPLGDIKVLLGSKEALIIYPDMVGKQRTRGHNHPRLSRSCTLGREHVMEEDKLGGEE